jgi:glycosyltransferase involved in cell wall biosynthesis
MTRVSVLLPLYDGEAYIREAVDSVLAQTHRDFELLILDDGSRDGSLAIVQDFARRDPRVRVIARENRGLTATLNELLAAADGELVARMDADDVCLPDRFARQIAFLAEHPEVVCVGGDAEMIDEQGRFLTVLRLPEDDAEIQRQALVGYAPLFHPAAMIRRRVLVAIGGYRKEYWPAEDLDLWLRLGEAGALANLPGPVLRYRLHADSISATNVARQRQAARLSCEAAWQRRGITNGRFEASDIWRPTTDRHSQQRFMLRFGWWAFLNGQRATALVYGWRAVRKRPLSVESWRLVVCSLCKPMRPLTRG